MKIKDLIDIGAKELRDIARRPKLEAEILLADALKQERIWLHMHYHDTVDAQPFFRHLELRKNYIPVEYILGRVSFYSEEFLITEGVLIPRPETEILVDVTSRAISENGFTRIIEIGTGSGIIAVMLALKHPQISITATDINPKAIELARKNAEKFGVAERIRFVETSYLDGIDGTFELLVSNPPYIANDFPLEPNLDHEPDSALFGGEAGDEMIKRIIDLALERGIQVMSIEMGYDQKEPLKEYFAGKGITDVAFYRDLAGLDRGFCADLRSRAS